MFHRNIQAIHWVSKKLHSVDTNVEKNLMKGLKWNFLTHSHILCYVKKILPPTDFVFLVSLQDHLLKVL